MKNIFRRRIKVYVYMIIIPKEDQLRLRKMNGSIGRKILTEIIEKQFHIPSNQLEIETTKEGKPYFIMHPSIMFNISDSGDFIVCAFTKQKNIAVGVDIEVDQDVNFDIMKRFFHVNEMEYVNEMEDEQQKTAKFLEIWTQKEAYVKWLGTGLTFKISSFDVTEKNIARYMITKRDDELGYTLTTYINEKCKVVYQAYAMKVWDI